MPAGRRTDLAPSLTPRRTRFWVTLTAIAAAVVLPMLMRALGFETDAVPLAVQGAPVILVGLLAGPAAGAIAGAVTPLVGFGLTGTPTADTFAFVLVELVGYGIVAGALATRNLGLFWKVLIAQVGGRLARLVAVAIAAHGITDLAASFAEGIAHLRAGLPGIVMQWLVIPLVVTWVRTRLEQRQPAPESA